MSVMCSLAKGFVSFYVKSKRVYSMGETTALRISYFCFFASNWIHSIDN